ncbi:hypothetical protein [Kutzneria sp. 744]|uniref:hypothetical protein n=1 Tax=Kutzneria sp. (strain 744) TaxID=345341 RepID=UPI0004B8D790|nr:hypothetical protein [Kutzneria sp. 744]
MTVVIEDTHLRVLHDGEEIAVQPRRDLTPITRRPTTGKGVKARVAVVKNRLKRVQYRPELIDAFVTHRTGT